MASNRVFAVITGKDNFLANIVDEENTVDLGYNADLPSGEAEVVTDNPLFVRGFKKNVVILSNVTIMIANGKQVGILPFKDLGFGSQYVTVPVSQITEIYLVNETLATQVRSTISGLVSA